MEKVILDACCGGKMFWFNKNHPNTIYIDKRAVEKGHIKYVQAKNHEVNPDEIMDFKHLRFADKAFKLVVFDPPHIVHVKDSGYQQAKYGFLDPITWQQDLKTGFEECWRVLDDYGVLVFKWNEVSKSVQEIISVVGKEPLFGHKSGKRQNTHWLCFMKLPYGE